MSAVYSSTISMSAYNEYRNRRSSRPVKSRPRGHVGRLELYSFNKELCEKIFAKNSDSKKDIGERLNMKWSSVAREVALTSKRGTKVVNSAQILQKFATEKGYTFHTGKRVRRTLYKHKGIRLAVSRPTSMKKIVERRDQMLSNGEIDTGRPICPTLSDIHKAGLEYQQEIFGRILDINKIRERHLDLMSAKNLLRLTDVGLLSLNGCKVILDRHNVKYDRDDPLYQLRQLVTDLETTRSFVCWADHSDLCAHSYYVIAVWFVYDQAVYLTPKEACGVNVQSIVEQPFLHMVARSKSSIHDQLQYIDQRIQEITSSSIPLTCGDREYNDVLRFYSGDLPSREFEAGAPGPSGMYPCPCGTSSATFSNPEVALQTPPFLDLMDRVAHFGAGKDPSYCYDVHSMKKAEVEKELMTREVHMTRSETVQELKTKLIKELKGVRRLPALLTTGRSRKDIRCETYEVSYCEPLHDLKNLIQCILEELPYQIKSKALKVSISKFCKDTLGAKILLKGCDARGYLVCLTKKLESPEYQEDRQCRGIYEMLYALTEIQRLAYQLDINRCERDVLHFYLVVLKFTTGYSTVFKEPKCNSKRLMFGTPYHSVILHFADMYRMMSLRSIVTETAERLFHELRQVTMCSNRQPDNIIKQIMVRFHFKMENNLNKSSDAFTSSQARIEKSTISLEAMALSTHDNNGRTILTREFMEENKLATMWTLRRISDYVKRGPGEWYDVDTDGNIIFSDATTDPTTRTMPKIAHFRSTSAAELNQSLCRDWDQCLTNAHELKIGILEQLQLQENSEDDFDQTCNQEDPIINEEILTDNGGILVNPAPSFSTSKVTITAKRKTSTGSTNQQRADLGEARQVSEFETLSTASTSKLPTVSSNARSSFDSTNIGPKALILLDIWMEGGYGQEIVEDFLKKRESFINGATNFITKSLFNKAHSITLPYLKLMEKKYYDELELLDEDGLTMSCQSRELEYKRLISIYYQIVPNDRN